MCLIDSPFIQLRFSMFILIFLTINIRNIQSSYLAEISPELNEKAKALLSNDLSIYLFSSTEYNERFLPEIGNGHIATQIKNKWIFVNGIYNGRTVRSHRACVPSTINWEIQTPDRIIHRIFQIDSLIGLTKEILVHSNYNITISTYISRHIRQIMVRNISLDTSDQRMSVLLTTLGNKFDFFSPDIDFKINKVNNFYILQGLTKIPENSFTTKLPIFMVTESIPSSMRLSYSKPWISFMTSIDNELDSALKALENALKTKTNLLYNHAKHWVDIWDDGIIQVTNSDKYLMQSIHAAQYYILSALPSKEWIESDPKWTYYGISPVGLAHGNDEDDYYGHVFWDMETWIYPAILPFHRHAANEMIKYRLMHLNSAMELSNKTGYKGSRFPWESARTGFETSPSKTCSDKEIHINSDISFATQQLLMIESRYNYSLYNLYGDSIIKNIAKFWASRVSVDSQNSKIDIIDVMPPDEYVHSCNNSAFTNIGAKLALEAPFLLAKRYGRKITDEMVLWYNLAKNISYVLDMAEKIILEHDTYKMGTIIKQADVVLLFYPFQISISDEYIRNSLEYYENVTDVEGPAMTWAIYSINWLYLKNINKADSLFQNNYGYINLPFYVWSESVNGTGAVNFYTGMGGYLQNIIYGFMGMRLDLNGNGRIIFDPSESSLIHGIVLHNIKFQNSNFDIKFSSQRINLQLLNDIPLNVNATENAITYKLTASRRFLQLSNQKIVITSLE